MKAVWVLVFFVGVLFLVWLLGRVDLPTNVTLTTKTGEQISGNLIGCNRESLTVEDLDTLQRVSIDKNDLAMPDSLLAWRYRYASPPPLNYPITKTITSADGRSFEGKIIGKSGGVISVIRQSDKSSFLIPISNLSEEDIEFVSRLPNANASDIESTRRREAKRNSLIGRHAQWHRTLHNAIKEGGKYDLPILLVFRKSEGEISNELDKNVYMTKEFRDWASKNVVLCLYYNNPGKLYEDRGLEGLSSKEGRDLAKEYGASSTPATVLLYPDGRKMANFSGYGRETAASYISTIEEKLSRYYGD